MMKVFSCDSLWIFIIFMEMHTQKINVVWLKAIEKSRRFVTGHLRTQKFNEKWFTEVVLDLIITRAVCSVERKTLYPPSLFHWNIQLYIFHRSSIDLRVLPISILSHFRIWKNFKFRKKKQICSHSYAFCTCYNKSVTLNVKKLIFLNPTDQYREGYFVSFLR